MFSRISFAILCVLTAGLCLLRAQAPVPAPPSPVPQASDAIRRDVNLVDVLFTVFNKQNKMVSNLEQTDFKVSDDGQ